MSDHRTRARTSLLARWAINAVAIWAAVQLVNGIDPVGDTLVDLFIVALIFGLVNAIIRPILTLLTCPLLILTLGLGTLLINAALFALTGAIGRSFGVGFTVAGFWPAFWGAIVVSIVSMLLSAVLGEGRRVEAD